MKYLLLRCFSPNKNVATMHNGLKRNRDNNVIFL